MLEEGLIVEDVVQLGVERGRVVPEETAEGRRQEHVERRREAFGKAAREGRQQRFRGGEVLGEDQPPRAAIMHDVEHQALLRLGEGLVDLARRRDGLEDVGKGVAVGFVKHRCLLLDHGTAGRLVERKL